VVELSDIFIGGLLFQCPRTINKSTQRVGLEQSKGGKCWRLAEEKDGEGGRSLLLTE
jgi:hypothetical protein